VTAYRLISAEQARTPISMACRLLGVSRCGYYEWAANIPSARAREDAELVERIVEIHGANRGVYGSPRIHAELAMAHGVPVGRKRVQRLMREAKISGMAAANAAGQRSRSSASGSLMISSSAGSGRARRTCSGSPT
jgi:putative transposase